jgi:hypothetical protein
MNKTTYKQDAKNFANLLQKTKLPNNAVVFGNFVLKGEKGVASKIQYNQGGVDLLQGEQQYTFELLTGKIELSMQLYQNRSKHYRLFCFTKFGKNTGLTFSVNLTTEKETENTIFLTQKIKFSEVYHGDQNLAKAHRQRKQFVMCEILKNLKIEVTENNDVILGIFDPISGILLDTTPEKFLNDFIVVALLKGHFQGNKGYFLEMLPKFDKINYELNHSDNEAENLPAKIISLKNARNIPLGLRYKVFKKDKNKCVVCGRNAVEDNVKLHIDHKIPYSLGGLTELSNLQVLCIDCNISKSNKFIDK